jgi:hypothetical protein
MKLKTLILSFIFSALFLTASTALAVTYTPQVPIPQVGNESNGIGASYVFEKDGTIKPIGLLVKDAMKYLIGIAGILGTIMLMYGGFLYIISGGQGKLITDAQNHIISAIVGIVLAATSYLILATVNTDLVNFKATKVTTIQAMGCCESSQSCSVGTKEQCSGKFMANGFCSSENKCIASDGSFPNENRICRYVFKSNPTLTLENVGPFSSMKSCEFDRANRVKSTVDKIFSSVDPCTCSPVVADPSKAGCCAFKSAEGYTKCRKQITELNCLSISETSTFNGADPNCNYCVNETAGGQALGAHCGKNNAGTCQDIDYLSCTQVWWGTSCAVGLCCK